MTELVGSMKLRRSIRGKRTRTANGFWI
jgi:hypothetical protein